MRLESTKSLQKKSRRAFWTSAIISGVALGCVMGGGLLWLWAKAYIESPDFWRSFSRNVGVEMSATTTTFSAFPLKVVTEAFEVRQGTARVVVAKNAELRVGVLPLLIGSLNLEVLLAGLEFFEIPKPVKTAPRSNKSSFDLPHLFFRKVSVHVLSEATKVPVAYLPRSDFEAMLEARAADEGQGFVLAIEKISWFGLTASGNATVAKNKQQETEGTFELLLPEKVSVLSGQIRGGFGSHGIKTLNADVKLPNAQVAVPEATRWLVGQAPLAVQGQVKLAGGVHLEAKPQADLWTAKADWDVDLTQAALSYAEVEKTVGFTLKAAGHFEGNETAWTLSQLQVQLGEAVALLTVAANAQKEMTVQAKAEPFEIAPLLQLWFAKKGQSTPRFSGRASGLANLKIINSEPTGTVKLDIDHWDLELASLQKVLGPSKMNVAGHILVEGNLNADLEAGNFKSANGRLLVDATNGEFIQPEWFQKKKGQTFLLDLTGEGSGKTLSLKNVTLAGPAGLKLSARGKISEFTDPQVKLQFLESKIPLTTLAEFIPRAGAATGQLTASGEVTGKILDPEQLFIKLQLQPKNVSIQHESVSITKLTGGLDVLIAPTGSLVRSEGIAGELVSPSVRFNGRGSLSLKQGAVSGDLGVATSELDLRPFLKKETEPQTPAQSNSNMQLSKLRVALRTPLIRTPFLDFKTVQGDVSLLRGNAFEIHSLAAKALEGELTLKGKFQGLSASDVFATAKQVDLLAVSKLVHALSGKNLENNFFGQANLTLQGKAVNGLSSALFTGTAEIINGGVKFAPLPKQTLDALRKVPGLGDKIPPKSDTDVVRDKFQAATAKFSLQGEDLGLDLEASDQLMTMSARGKVSLSGKCELQGTVVPKSNLVGGTLGSVLARGLPFQSSGERWDCNPKIDFAALGTRAIEDVAKEKVKDVIKGILGH